MQADNVYNAILVVQKALTAPAKAAINEINSYFHMEVFEEAELLTNITEHMFVDKGAHGFMRTHKWHHSIGAFINVEASGTGGLDLVYQSGPGSWPSSVYAQSAIYPMAHSAAQVLLHSFIYFTFIQE
ncbi:hypothetical protein ES332_D08G178500v1 [Gossypium tomentosum]|uniref:Peptidase M28 domain-containing protein n=1 Tax=Gossypium tomentosum TaxID=34277 RepID=A0A5D2JVC2_GOSTO|nr:hypothetical protein ES332_D08G178500v1 [Gossypium tomentosum]